MPLRVVQVAHVVEIFVGLFAIPRRRVFSQDPVAGGEESFQFLTGEDAGVNQIAFFAKLLLGRFQVHSGAETSNWPVVRQVPTGTRPQYFP